jgi:hypothetical protein
MKARLFTLAAVAATTLLSQGVAQSDSLERALADLNSGLVAPAGNSAVTWGGNFRLRNAWADNDSTTNNRDFDTRMRLTASFNVTEDSMAFVGFNGSEAWGDSSDPTNFFPVPGAENTATRVDRAYVTVNNLMGDGGTVSVGRNYYVVGAVRVIGSDDWDNNPSAYSGVWYDHDMGGLNFKFAMLNGTETGQTAASDGDDMLYVASIDYALEAGSMGTISLTPYLMRSEADNSGNWKGLAFSGEVAGFDYDAEYSQYNDHDDTADGSAWYVATSLNLEFLGEVPGISDGSVDISFSNADDEFATSNPMTHNVGGFADYGTGGTWDDGKDITTFGLNISPADGWNGRVALNDTSGITSNYSEIDISLGHDFNGNVSGWFGYGMVNDDDANVADSVLFWTTLELAF